MYNLIMSVIKIAALRKYSFNVGPRTALKNNFEANQIGINCLEMMNERKYTREENWI